MPAALGYCRAAMDAAVSPPDHGPLPAYRAKLAAGELALDISQQRAAERLQALWIGLRHYNPKPSGGGGMLARLLRRKPGPGSAMPKGLYLVGEVGRGKSMLMDLFFATAEVHRRQRIHFHRFMQNAHQRIHDIRRENPGIGDPIPPLADTIAADAALLCFDEFQVTNIADALILGRLFQALFERGVVMVATSNTRPDDLFKGQPGRDAFLPFIGLIKARLDLFVMDEGQDFRRDRLRELSTWHVPADGRADAALDAAFEALTGQRHGDPETLTVMGRDFRVPQAAGGVARLDFSALCGAALGAGDYLALATRFHTLILDGIPRLSPDNFDQARRFITLIDTLYDHRVKLLASAADMPDRLYMRGENAKMFERTASRLEEMQSRDWMELEHLA